MYQQRNRSEERPVIEPNSNLIVKGLPLFMEESQVGNHWCFNSIWKRFSFSFVNI